MKIDINYNFREEVKEGQDIDSVSPTLRKYHKILWSKQLPNGKSFNLSDSKPGAYLYHKSDVGEFYMGSDSISHSYGYQKRKQWISEQIPDEVFELFLAGCTIGAYIIFPNNKIDCKMTINGARGCNSLIDDRFDLTLECIRRYYIEDYHNNPLYNTLSRYNFFFELFGCFENYVEYFLLQDLVDSDGNIKFHLPFDDFKSPPVFSKIADYLLYKERIMNFINKRNARIKKYELNF